VRGGERPQLVSLNLVSSSAQDANLPVSDYQEQLRAVLVMTERPLAPVQILLDSTSWCWMLTVTSGG
jgi:hypothetical protein